MVTTQPPSEDHFQKLKDNLEAERRKAANLKEFGLAVDVVEKNKDADVGELRKEFETLKREIEQKRQCHERHLGDHVIVVKNALDGIDGWLDSQQKKIGDEEPALMGELELQSHGAKRSYVRAKKAFELLLVNNLTNQLGEARNLVKAADGYTGASLADHAAAFSLLRLAEERLQFHSLPADYLLAKVPFKFPDDYPMALISACLKMNELAEEAAVNQQEFNEKKLKFEKSKRLLSSKRESRKKDGIEAALKAVQGSQKTSP